MFRICVEVNDWTAGESEETRVRWGWDIGRGEVVVKVMLEEGRSVEESRAQVWLILEGINPSVFGPEGKEWEYRRGMILGKLGSVLGWVPPQSPCVAGVWLG